MCFYLGINHDSLDKEGTLSVLISLVNAGAKVMDPHIPCTKHLMEENYNCEQCVR